MARRYYRRRYRSNKNQPASMVFMIIVGLILFGVYYGIGGGLLGSLNQIVFGFLLILGVVGLGLIGFLVWYENRRMKDVGMDKVDGMTGEEFEHYVAFLCKGLGGKNVKVTSYEGDFGADVLTNFNDQKYVIQAKRYKDKVGVKVVGEIVMGKGYYDADKAMVVTNSYLTRPALESAGKNEVEVIDRPKLIEWIRRVNKAQNEVK